MATSKLAWYVNRLRSMSAPEVAYRVGEQVKRRQARGKHGSLDMFVQADGPLPFIVPPTDAGLAHVAGANRQAWMLLEREVRAGTHHLLGLDWPVEPGPAKWHLDAVSGQPWPSDIYCFDVPYRHASGFGDVKFVWELGRLQHLPPLAAAWRAGGDAALGDLVCAELESWIDANPPYLGVGWVSGIELSMRTVSILLTLGLLDGYEIPPALQTKLKACLSAHGFWLHRYPSKFSSANNHLIAEATGLFVLSTCWPAHPEAEKWRRYGLNVLTSQVTKQFHEDGIGAEQSPTYTAFTLEWYLTASHVARSAGQPFSPQVEARLAQAGRALRTMMDCAGQCPRIGDDDEGAVTGSGQGREELYVTSVLAGLATHLDCPDAAPPVAAQCLRNAYLGEAVQTAPPADTAHSFTAGGYTVLRESVGGQESLLIFDHGPLGHLSIAGHGHADALSLWLHVGGVPVLIDAGTYLYHAGAEWRDLFRGTGAHNTVIVGDTDQSEILGPFNWGRKARTTLIAAAEAVEGFSVSADHDGYAKTHRLRHIRTVSRAASGVYRIEDRLEGNSDAGAEARWLINPALKAAAEGREASIALPGGGFVTLESTTPFAARDGWASAAFGHKTEALQLVNTLNESGEAERAASVTLRIQL